MTFDGEWDEVVDLAIVGAGTGGMLAARVASDAGLDVALYEKSQHVGGGAAYSGAVLWAPNSSLMAKKGIDDSVEEALTYLDAASGGRADTDLGRAYIETMPRVLDLIEEMTPLKFIIWRGQPDYYPDLPGAKREGRQVIPHPMPAVMGLDKAETEHPEMAKVRPSPHMDLYADLQRFSAGKKPRDVWVAGRALAGALWLAVIERHIPCTFGAHVSSLVDDGNGTVVGIRLEVDGEVKHVRARGGVLLNTGGFEWNEELTRRYVYGPQPKPFTPPSNTGDGLLMATRLGAGTALMDQSMINPCIEVPGETHDGAPLYRMVNEQIGKPHSIVVNEQGKRFANDASYFALAEGWLSLDTRHRRHPNLPSWWITDNRYRRQYGLPMVESDAAVPDWVASADTLDELARKIDVNADNLVAQVERFNSDIVNGVDDEFERGKHQYDDLWGDPAYESPTLGTLEEGPFYAIPVYPGTAGHRGGLVLNPRAEVVRADGEPISHLYACGNVAAHLMIGAGYGSGIAIGSSLVFGYITATEVARSLSDTSVASQ